MDSVCASVRWEVTERRIDGRLGVIGVDSRRASCVHRLKRSGVGAVEGLSMGRNRVFCDMLSREIRLDLKQSENTSATYRMRCTYFTASLNTVPTNRPS